jgi:hypothetical protein
MALQSWKHLYIALHLITLVLGWGIGAKRFCNLLKASQWVTADIWAGDTARMPCPVCHWESHPGTFWCSCAEREVQGVTSLNGSSKCGLPTLCVQVFLRERFLHIHWVLALGQVPGYGGDWHSMTAVTEEWAPAPTRPEATGTVLSGTGPSQ